LDLGLGARAGRVENHRVEKVQFGRCQRQFVQVTDLRGDGLEARLLEFAQDFPDDTALQRIRLVHPGQRPRAAGLAGALSGWSLARRQVR